VHRARVYYSPSFARNSVVLKGHIQHELHTLGRTRRRNNRTTTGVVYAVRRGRAYTCGACRVRRDGRRTHNKHGRVVRFSSATNTVPWGFSSPFETETNSNPLNGYAGRCFNNCRVSNTIVPLLSLGNTHHHHHHRPLVPKPTQQQHADTESRSPSLEYTRACTNDSCRNK